MSFIVSLNTPQQNYEATIQLLRWIVIFMGIWLSVVIVYFSCEIGICIIPKIKRILRRKHNERVH